MATSKAKAEQEKRDPNEVIVMRHKGISRTARASLRQFEQLHSKKGWEEVEPDADGNLPEGTPPLMNIGAAPAATAQASETSSTESKTATT